MIVTKILLTSEIALLSFVLIDATVQTQTKFSIQFCHTLRYYQQLAGSLPWFKCIFR